MLIELNFEFRDFFLGPIKDIKFLYLIKISKELVPFMSRISHDADDYESCSLNFPLDSPDCAGTGVCEHLFIG